MGDAKSWTEVCTSSAGLNTMPNTESLPVFDDSTVSLVRQIGEGGQGRIYDAKFYTPFSFKPHPVIVKKFKPLEGISQGHLPQQVFSAQGNYVCRPFGAVYKGDSLCIIMKKYSADLRGHIDECMKDLQDEQWGYDGPPFAEEIAVYTMVQLAMGLRTLHEWGVYHRDLKAANILVNRYRTPDGERYPGFDVTIADFETSESVVGTGFFRAPEVLQSLRTRVPLTKDQWKVADIYSFGMICYEVLTGKVPFEGHQINDYDLVLDGGRPELPDHVPEFLKNIILRCWHADPNSRPCWTDIIQALMQSSDVGDDLVENADVGDDLVENADVGDDLVENADVGDDLVENPERTMDYLVNLESSSAGSSVESMIMELKEKVEIHREELERIEARGFVDHIYWASEFAATVEKYASKFDVESNLLDQGLLLYTLPGFLERFQLFGLLRHQLLGFGYAIHACKCQQNMDDHMNVEVKSSSVVFMLQAQELSFLVTNLHNRIGEVQSTVLCVGEPDGPGSWFRKLMFYRALFNWIYWNELGEGSFIPDIVNLQDDVQVHIFHVCLLVLKMTSAYLNLLALFTVEPILLGIQYGMYKIKSCNNFLHHSSGYRICRLQRAWMNFTRYRPVSVTLIVSLIYLGSRYGWKGILGWTVFPFILRFSFWRGWRLM